MDEEQWPEYHQHRFRSGLLLFDKTGCGLLSKSLDISDVRVGEPCGATITFSRCAVPMLFLVYRS